MFLFVGQKAISEEKGTPCSIALLSLVHQGIDPSRIVVPGETFQGQTVNERKGGNKHGVPKKGVFPDGGGKNRGKVRVNGAYHFLSLAHLFQGYDVKRIRL